MDQTQENSKQARAEAKAEASAAKARAKALRPWFKKKRFVLPIALIVIIGISTSLGRDGGTSNPSADDTSQEASIEANETEEVKEFPNETLSQTNAREKALSYLDTMAFSRDGLIDQLEFEDFSMEDAEYAVDIIEVDWNEQASLKAESYLDTMAFSEKGLVEQLEFEGFAKDQAKYGVGSIQVDWMEQAALKAEDYLSSQSFSKQGLIDQLIFEGFTQEQANFGVTQAGF